MKSNTFIKQYLFCLILATTSVLAFYLIDKNSTFLFYTIVLFIYMPSPLYAVAIFDREYLKNQLAQLKEFSIKNYFRAFLKTLLVFYALVLLNYLFYYIFKQYISYNIIGELSFNNENIYKNIVNLIPQNIPLPEPQFKNDNGFPLFIFLLIIIPIIGSFINSIFAFTEEVGWRGSFLNKLTIKSKIIKNTLMGILWGIWHSPLILAFGYNYPNISPIAGISLMILFCISLHYLFVVLNGYTVIFSTLIHGCINASPGLYILFHSNYHDAFSLICGIIPVISISFITIFLLFIKKWKLIS